MIRLAESVVLANPRVWRRFSIFDQVPSWSRRPFSLWDSTPTSMPLDFGIGRIEATSTRGNCNGDSE